MLNCRRINRISWSFCTKWGNVLPHTRPSKLEHPSGATSLYLLPGSRIWRSVARFRPSRGDEDNGGVFGGNEGVHLRLASHRFKRPSNEGPIDVVPSLTVELLLGFEGTVRTKLSLQNTAVVLFLYCRCGFFLGSIVYLRHS